MKLCDIEDRINIQFPKIKSQRRKMLILKQIVSCGNDKEMKNDESKSGVATLRHR